MINESVVWGTKEHSLLENGGSACALIYRILGLCSWRAAKLFSLNADSYMYLYSLSLHFTKAINHLFKQAIRHLQLKCDDGLL